MQEEIDVLFRWSDRCAVARDHIEPRSDLRPELRRNLTVDPDPALEDQCLAAPARAEPGARQIPLKPLLAVPWRINLAAPNLRPPHPTFLFRLRPAPGFRSPSVWAAP